MPNLIHSLDGTTTALFYNNFGGNVDLYTIIMVDLVVFWIYMRFATFLINKG
jgi:hypothetical protein